MTKYPREQGNKNNFSDQKAGNEVKRNFGNTSKFLKGTREQGHPTGRDSYFGWPNQPSSE